MTQHIQRKTLTSEEHLVEGRLAVSFARVLTAASESPRHDISERLRFSRDSALQHAREARTESASEAVLSGSTKSGAVLLSGFVPWWQRVASLLPVLILAIGFVAIDHWSAREQVMAAADFDALLLADDLPPEAYSDPGFVEFLRTPSNP